MEWTRTWNECHYNCYSFSALTPKEYLLGCFHPKRNPWGQRAPKTSSQCTMGQNHFILRHQKFTFPRAREWAKWASERTSGRSGGRERSEQSGASERVSSVTERANGRASGLILHSVFLAVFDHSGLASANRPCKSLKSFHLDTDNHILFLVKF